MSNTPASPAVESNMGIRDPRKLSTEGETLYELLEIPKGASLDEIKTAYRKLALRCHPDKNPGDPKAGEMFAEVNRANTILSDQEKRKFYDKYGSYGLYLADQMGEDVAEAYLRVNNPCMKCLIIACFLLTGCCCCCCCCCCCRICRSDLDEDNDYTHVAGEPGGDESNDTDGRWGAQREEQREPISTQPIVLGPQPET